MGPSSGPVRSLAGMAGRPEAHDAGVLAGGCCLPAEAGVDPTRNTAG